MTLTAQVSVVRLAVCGPKVASVSQAAGSSAGASVGATAVQLSVRELDLHGSLSAIQRLRSASCSVRRLPVDANECFAPQRRSARPTPVGRLQAQCGCCGLLLGHQWAFINASAQRMVGCEAFYCVYRHRMPPCSADVAAAFLL